jgi:hypothetical protein
MRLYRLHRHNPYTGRDCHHCGDAILENVNQVILPATGMVLHSVCTICHAIPETVPQEDMPSGSIKRGAQCL